MILATRDDYDHPNIDWLCKKCGMVYCSAGYPPETRCMEGHGQGWRPDPRQVSEYIDVIESLEPGDGIVISGDGPATLMGSVESIGDGQLITEPMDSPSRTLRWERGDSDADRNDWKPTLSYARIPNPTRPRTLAARSRRLAGLDRGPPHDES